MYTNIIPISYFSEIFPLINVNLYILYQYLAEIYNLKGIFFYFDK